MPLGSLSDHIATMLYVAFALPDVRRRSPEAAARLEGAIAEMALQLAKKEYVDDLHFSPNSYLRYALQDVELIAPAAAQALEAAIECLSEEVQSDAVPKEGQVLH